MRCRGIRDIAVVALMFRRNNKIIRFQIKHADYVIKITRRRPRKTSNVGKKKKEKKD